MARQIRRPQVVIAVTGSIAAYKACDIIRLLQSKDIEVTAILTKNAKRFVTPLTFATLCAGRVYEKMFDDHQKRDIYHVSLAEKADVFLIAPATANVLAKMACGIADDLTTATALTTQAPILVAPAMNTLMYKNKITRENICRLKKQGMHFVDPVKGKLACGTIGQGHLADPGEIVKKVCTLLKKS